MAQEAERQKIALIEAAFARDDRERPPARRLGDIPAFYECITAEWLTAVIRLRHPDATVTGFRLGERDSGTTNRRRIFLDYAEADRDKGYPSALFCKGAQDLANRITMSAGSGVGEVTFYNDIRPVIDFDAPIAYFAGHDPATGRSIIVFDDMAREVEFCTFRTPVNRARAESQIDLLARMHGRFLGAAAADRALLAGMGTWQDRFRLIERYHGLADGCYRGMIAAAPVMPARLLARIDEVWPRTVESVDRMDSLSQTITHGDVHLGNWYVRPGDRMGLTDFQNCTRGHWSRDLAYAIATALDVEHRRAWERDLIALYLDRLRAHGGPAETFDAVWRNYRQQMLSALAWWTITLTPSPSMAQDMQPRDTTLAFLERLGHAADDLQSLDSF